MIVTMIMMMTTTISVHSTELLFVFKYVAATLWSVLASVVC